MKRFRVRRLLLGLGLLVFVVCLFEQVSGYPQEEPPSDNTSRSRDILYILALSPQPDSRYNVGWDGGPGLLPAARLAVDQINNRTDILSHYELRLIEEDSGCFLTSRALIGYTRSVLEGERNVIAAVGPGCSPAAATLGPLSNAGRIPFVQVTIATSPEFEDRAAYPYTFATISASSRFVPAFLSLMDLYNWTTISVIFQGNSLFHRTILSTLEKQLQSANRSVSSFAMFETYFPLEQLIQARTTIVVVIATRALARRLMCMAFRHERKLIHPVYQWVFLVRTFSDFIADEFCTLPEYREALTNAMFLEHNIETRDRVNTTVSGLTYDEYTQDLALKISEYENETGLNVTRDYLHGLVFSTVYHDAVWALALSLDNVSRSSSVNLSDYRPGRNSTIPDLIVESLYGVEFKGVSGEINFNRSTAHASSVITFYQVRGNESLVFIHYDQGRIVEDFENHTSIRDSFEIVYVLVNPYFGAVLFLLVFIELFVIIFFHIFTFLHRNEKSIKGSSVHLNHIIYVGCYMFAVAAVLVNITGLFRILNQTAGHFICNLQLWLYTVSSNIIMATVCVKTWRLYRIFIHYMHPGGALLSDPVLFVVILILQIPSILGLIIVVRFFRSSWESPSVHAVDSDGKATLRIASQCTTTWHIGLLLAPYFVMLLSALLLTLVNSKKIAKMYRRTKSTAFIVYTHSIVYPIVITLTVISGYENWGLYVIYVLENFSAHFYILTCILFLIVPPVIPFIREKFSSVEKHKFSFVT